MNDSMQHLWSKLLASRYPDLNKKFPGIYRAVVVETNDPLNMGRVRFRCPDIHDYNIDIDKCPWAIPAPWLGSKGSGQWASLCIGDVILVAFERGHPFGPIIVGTAAPTRRRFYPLPSVHGKTPVALNSVGGVEGLAIDYNEDYLPKDGRPMSVGYSDRYGNLDAAISVGFFPSEHDKKPIAPGMDAIQKAAFDARTTIPVANSPDLKCMVRISKYGIMQIHGDQGYAWKKEGEFGEFTGNFDDDLEFERKRWLYLQKLINEGETANHDARRSLTMTPYGCFLELKDVGWAQPGPSPSRSRTDEYGLEQYLSREMIRDERGIRIGTPAGWLAHWSDVGADPAEHKSIKRTRLEMVRDDSAYRDWRKRDARMWRVVSPSGLKLVVDDRGSSRTDPIGEEKKRGNGFLVKGRRTPGSSTTNTKTGDPRGFYWEINENNSANHTTWGSPLGQIIELNDNYEYLAMCAGLGREYATKWKHLSDNEFLLEPTRLRDLEQITHHLVFDQQNEYVRLKTKGGKGTKPDNEINPSALKDDDEPQGMEMHCGSKGDGAWVELVDADRRGFWLSRKQGLGIWRGQRDKQIYLWINDKTGELVLYNASGKKTRIYSNGDLELMSEQNVTVQGKTVNLRADDKIRMEVAGSQMTLSAGRLDTNARFYGDEINAFVVGVQAGDGAGEHSPGGERVEAIRKPDVPAAVEPTDRARRYNDIKKIDETEVSPKL